MTLIEKKQINLYSSAECCLCDDALALFEMSHFCELFSIKKIDIYTDKSLLVKYRTKIPVMELTGNDGKLYWPFDAVELDRWLNALVS